MRRTSARSQMGRTLAVATAVAAIAGLTAWQGAAAEQAPPALAAGSPEGYGAGTTGGAGGPTVTVSDADAFIDAAASDGPLQIRVSGTIQLDDMEKVTSDKTIVGTGTSGAITGGGLNVSKADNVIIQNLRFTGADDDAINVQYSTHVWIDHNDISDAYDGACDVKRASDSVTISWNHFHDQDKNALLGHSDDNGSEDRGKLHVSYHHNWFDATTQRNPRVRFGNPVHVYNNYYNDNSGYGVASTEDAGVLVEGNYFENVEDPYHLGEADSGPGSLVARNNQLVNSGPGQTGGSVSTPSYSYRLDSAANVKSIVRAGAGVGHI
ncbi:pectate trisaccharide-lyase [Streptomyces sulfonofaciens]|uniref:pectate lyase n=1 Tax=Streptomyces sulfonofaciens TaxID=68272 RepID=A0A919G9L2_9ACTN|nr:right-handed parallel beta-helix repeat-containing protein [Streptomyces sulfonofaciens]GHH80498.1 pectate trisaccharide-lyase [Streptomyces sulfonofaciens]